MEIESLTDLFADSNDDPVASAMDTSMSSDEKSHDIPVQDSASPLNESSSNIGVSSVENNVLLTEEKQQNVDDIPVQDRVSPSNKSVSHEKDNENIETLATHSPEKVHDNQWENKAEDFRNKDAVDEPEDISGNQKENADIETEHNEGSQSDTGDKEMNVADVSDMHVNGDKTDIEDGSISIDENEIVKAKDVYGRGKRQKVEKQDGDHIYANSDEDLFIKKKSPFKSKGLHTSPKNKSPFGKGVKYNKNVNLEDVTLPFSHGWKRELVIRNNFDFTKAGTMKPHKPIDVYYHPPKGRKLRSMKELIDYLKQTKSPLKENNFTFLRHPVAEPPFEIMRHAGKSRITKKPEIVIERDGDDVLDFEEPKSPPLSITKSPFTSEKKLSKLDSSGSKRGRPRKQLLKPRRNSDANVSSEFVPSAVLPSSTSVDGPPPPKKFKATARKSTTQKSLKRKTVSPGFTGQENLCTLHCPGQEGIPPSLCCVSCQCLFHPSCVAFAGNPNHDIFTCLRCVTSGPKAQGGTATGSDKRNSSGNTGGISVYPNDLKAEMASANHRNSPVPVLRSPSGIEPSPRPTALTNSNYLGSRPGIASQTGITNPNLTPVSRMSSSKLIPLSSFLPSTSVFPMVPNNNILMSSSPVPPLHSATTITTPPNTSLVQLPLSNIPSHTPPLQNSVQSTPLNNSQIDQRNGQILTLPGAVTKRLNMQQPLAIKINNTSITVPPSSYLKTDEGLKLFLPPHTFPVSIGETAKLSVTVTNDKGASSQPQISINMFSEANKHLGTKMDTKTAEKLSGKSSEEKTDKRTKVALYKDVNVGKCFIQKLHGGFDAIVSVFGYLSTKDLLRVSQVCKTWNRLAMLPVFWHELKLQGLKVTDWKMAAIFISKNFIKTLNLCGISHGGDMNATWHQLVASLSDLTCLRQLYFDLVPGSVLHAVFCHLVNLEVLQAEQISDNPGEQMMTNLTRLDISKASSLCHLRVLQLRGVAGLTLSSYCPEEDLCALSSLKNLENLALTTVKDKTIDLGFLKDLKSLKQLELGDCVSWSSQNFADIGKLSCLQSLRLENGGSVDISHLAKALEQLTSLEVLELILFKMDKCLVPVLNQLDRLHSLIIWPDTISVDPALSNSLALSVVSQLYKLKHLHWGAILNPRDTTHLSKDGKVVKSEVKWISLLPGGLDGASEGLALQQDVPKFKESLATYLPNTCVKIFGVTLPPHLMQY